MRDNTDIYAGTAFSYKSIRDAFHATVNVDGIFKNSVYGTSYLNFRGTGFLVNTHHGLIATNKHIANLESESIFFVEFFNGRKLKASFYYDDPIFDFAFIQVNPDEIPSDVNQVIFSNKTVEKHDPVFMVGSNEGTKFSLQTGIIVDMTSTIMTKQTQNMKISLNTKGGSSGSAVFNLDGEVIAINFAGTETTAIALKGSYVNDATMFLTSNIVPNRNHVGVTFNFHTLDDIKMLNLITQEDYNKAIIDTDKILFVENVYNNEILKLYDLIWSVNATNPIIDDLYLLQKYIDQSNKILEFNIIRNQEHIALQIEPYNLEFTRSNNMLLYMDAVFSTSNEYLYLIYGIKPETVVLLNVPESSPFSSIAYMAIKKVNGIEIESAVDLACAFKNLYAYEHDLFLISGMPLMPMSTGVMSETINNPIEFITPFMTALFQQQEHPTLMTRQGLSWHEQLYDCSTMGDIHNEL